MTEAPVIDQAWRAAQLAARRWRLPFSRQAWRGGPVGNWLGVGAGSSLDFQDHRAYAPGDDPRHIHWAAYARTGQLTMKLYRAEVAPVVDVAVDVSASMTLTAEKLRRTDELVAFCVACADRAGAACRVHAVDGARVQAVATAEVRTGRWRERLSAAGGGVAPRFALWRAGALKVLISDLLYPGDPSLLLSPLAAGAGVAVVFAPALEEEARLGWRGNADVRDCESDARRRQRADDSLAARYAAAYARHFQLWREAARRKGVLLASVPAEGEFRAVLAGAARSAGAVEPA